MIESIVEDVFRQQANHAMFFSGARIPWTFLESICCQFWETAFLLQWCIFDHDLQYLRSILHAALSLEGPQSPSSSSSGESLLQSEWSLHATPDSLMRRMPKIHERHPAGVCQEPGGKHWSAVASTSTGGDREQKFPWSCQECNPASFDFVPNNDGPLAADLWEDKSLMCYDCWFMIAMLQQPELPYLE